MSFEDTIFEYTIVVVPDIVNLIRQRPFNISREQPKNTNDYITDQTWNEKYASN